MAGLQPVQALSLDPSQQDAFVSFFRSLPQVNCTVRLFSRGDYYSVHGNDATLTAIELYGGAGAVKYMFSTGAKHPYVTLNKNNFETFVRNLLLIKHYRVEIYTNEGTAKSQDWIVKYKASPGNLSQLEDVVTLNPSEGGEVGSDAPLMAVCFKHDSASKGFLIGVCFVDVASHRILHGDICGSQEGVLGELEAMVVQQAPAECVLPNVEAQMAKLIKKIMERSLVIVTHLQKSTSSKGSEDDQRLKSLLKESSFANLSRLQTVERMACNNAVEYLQLVPNNLYTINKLDSTQFMLLDSSALSALNVLPLPGDSASFSGGGGAPRSLYALLDRCMTQQGKRELWWRLRRPLRSIPLIEERLEVVSALIRNGVARSQIRACLRRLGDLEWLGARLASKKVQLHHCYRIYQCVERMPEILEILLNLVNDTINAYLVEPLRDALLDLEKYQEMIRTTVDMDAIDKGEYLVVSSWSTELEEAGSDMERLRKSAEKLTEWATGRLRMSANAVKLDWNDNTGYNFRVTLKEEVNLRGDKEFKIQDTLRSGVRFTHKKLDAISSDYLAARDLYLQHQKDVVAEIINIASGYSDVIVRAGRTLAALDVGAAGAEVAAMAPTPYCRPVLVPQEGHSRLELRALRHPCLELQSDLSYVANDVVLDEDNRLAVITGANMGGKSTLLRATGTAALLAGGGWFVPASKAVLTPFASLRARCGAHDAEHLAQSTFMTEMLDAADIINNSRSDTLVLIDELGRGTSTYEGCGLAWAIAEDLATEAKCLTLFATHYGELTRLEQECPGVVNWHVSAEVVDGQLVLLHRLKNGAAPRSLGLHVAKLAKLPDDVLEYAERKQSQLETDCKDSRDEDAEEGKKIIEEFLTSCKKMAAGNLSDEELQSNVAALKCDLLKCNNSYVKSLII